jgi:indole-3-glycerol phosphate synthase
MPASLDSILASTRQRLSERRSMPGSADGMAALERAASEYIPRGFREKLLASAGDGIAVIAELKKASPSKGLIRADFRPLELARELEQAGASALSVLTDETFFQGSLDYLRQASSSASLPCLRKDFIVDEFQIVEARANRADAILLIVAALEQTALASLAGVARSQGLDVLCEAHDENEVRRALDAGCDLIGINSRNLRTFEVDLTTALRLADQIPASCVRVAESGIHRGQDVARLRSAGFQAFLIGESLMAAAHPGAALKTILAEAKAAMQVQGAVRAAEKLTAL